MASVTGYVQMLAVIPGSTYTKAWVGPSASDSQMLVVIMESGDTTREVAIKSALIDAMSTALAARREITVSYDSDSRVTLVEMSRA